MKAVLKVVCLFFVIFVQSSFAASCDIDKGQMYDQISKYGSISTKGCPFNAFGWGVVSITNPVASSGSCSATCSYASGPGSQGVSCSWEKGNWGDTLTCGN
ncbi:hypothetical protein [Legionella sp. W05-934-2]|jgi:hypothetical protein|uniref:hypothetical protein n=1 Tax=Legionella sp. W05-934-2 TaxID=1198649 RepID=UPI003461A625